MATTERITLKQFEQAVYESFESMPEKFDLLIEEINLLKSAFQEAANKTPDDPQDNLQD